MLRFFEFDESARIYSKSQETKEGKKKIGVKYKGSHVDWWLYEDAQPWVEFEVIKYDGCSEAISDASGV